MGLVSSTIIAIGGLVALSLLAFLVHRDCTLLANRIGRMEQAVLSRLARPAVSAEPAGRVVLYDRERVKG
jgi:hypothetical protein